MYRATFAFSILWLIASCTTPPSPPASSQGATLTLIGEFRSGRFDESAAEIVAYHPRTRTLYVTNADANSLDLLDLTDPSAPTLSSTVDLTAWGGGPNSVAVHGDLVAVAVENANKQANGLVVFLDPAGEYLGFAETGPLPDMVTFTPDGNTVLTANEGEPNDAYTVDPEGSVSVIDLTAGIENPRVRTADFSGITQADLSDSVRIFGPDASIAQDLEPEYIAVSLDGNTAYVTLQENNALAIVDLPTARVTSVVGLGFKHHALDANAFDASNKDDGIRMQAWPVKGMYQPDALAAFISKGRTFLVTANEGDARDYEGYSEETRIGKLKLDPNAFPAAEFLQESAALGRLKTTTAHGDSDGDGDFDELYAYGARSFSIWDDQGTLVFDSGDQLERILAQELPLEFNSTNDENDSFDNRSDDKGPEPEGLVVGQVGTRILLFLGLERVGGIMVFDLTEPNAPVFVDYVTTRNFQGDPKADTAGNLGPEGLVFIPGGESPNGKPLLAVAYEVSGSVALFEIE